MYVCMYIYIYLYIEVHIHRYVYICIYTHLLMPKPDKASNPQLVPASGGSGIPAPSEDDAGQRSQASLKRGADDLRACTGYIGFRA